MSIVNQISSFENTVTGDKIVGTLQQCGKLLEQAKYPPQSVSKVSLYLKELM